MTDPGDLLIGRTLGGRYRVVRRIRAGGMGIVYEAVQVDLGRHVAVKVLTQVVDEPALARFKLEAEAAARLGHPHIVQVSDFQSAHGDEPPFLVMELLVGRSLADLVANEAPIPWQRAARIGAQVLDALAAAHDARIVHRDIKPDNVFLVASKAVPDMVKVLDFGIAKLLEPLPGGRPVTRDGSVIGTLAYMAPEQARGDAVDERCDLYALAACLYELVTARRPIQAPLEMFRAAIAAAEPEPIVRLRPDVDASFAAIVMRGLAKSPSERFASAREMGDAIARCAGIEVEAPRTVRDASHPEPMATRTSGGVATTIGPNETLAHASAIPATAPLAAVPPRMPIPPQARGTPPPPALRSGMSGSMIAALVLAGAMTLGVFVYVVVMNWIVTRDYPALGGAGIPPAASVPLPGPVAVVCSTSSNPQDVTFVNETAEPVEIWWVGYSCEEHSFGTMKPGAFRKSKTFASHVWRFRAVGTHALLQDVLPRPTSAPTRIAFTGAR